MPIRPPNEDLFEDSRMSFGQHLEELRKVLFKSVAGVAVGCVFGFLVADYVVEFLTQPLKSAVGAFHQAESRKTSIENRGWVPPEWQPLFEKENVAPERMLIDPGELAKALGSINPDLIKDIDLRPYFFKSRHFDLAKLPTLCARFKKPGDEHAKSKIDFLRKKLTTLENNQISEIAKKSVAVESDVQAVVEILNRVITDVNLSSVKEFQPWVTAAPTSFWSFLNPSIDNPLVNMKAELEEQSDSKDSKDSIDHELNRRINRVLVTRCFVDLMPPVKLDLIEMQIWRQIDVEPLSLSTTESFMIWVKAGIFTGLIISSPWVLFQFWMFVAAGLYPHEQHYVYIFLPISLILFAAGAGLAFFFVFEPVLEFLFSFNASLGISPQIRIKEWLSFVMFLPFGFGVAFQLPLVMLFLNRINVFSVAVYLSKWRIAVMVIFTLSMLLTPADPISMIMLAIPLTMLYFFGVALCQWLPKGRNPYGEEAVARNGDPA